MVNADDGDTRLALHVSTNRSFVAEKKSADSAKVVALRMVVHPYDGTVEM